MPCARASPASSRKSACRTRRWSNMDRRSSACGRRARASEEEMTKVSFVDVTLRDGHQSLWAERMKTAMMLPAAERLDRAGFDALEIFSPSHVGKCVVELREDPFARIRLLAQRILKTPLRLNAGGLNPC